MKIISKRRAMTIYRQHPEVYAERRQDRNGPYACLMSITLN